MGTYAQSSRGGPGLGGLRSVVGENQQNMGGTSWSHSFGSPWKWRMRKWGLIHLNIKGEIFVVQEGRGGGGNT